MPFREFALDLQEGAVIHADKLYDKLYNDYVYEDLLREAGSLFKPL
ncbi:MAG: hypothetical protein KY468_15885 [Armatimonadetes bacterium]|nr:hypothetical protein [Armatimonadota bacterium]